MTNYPVVAQSKRGRPRRNTLSKASRLVMTKIAKKVVQNEAELKHNTGSQVNFSIPTTGQIGILSNPAQGDTQVDRTGIEINALYMNIKYHVLWDTAGTGGAMTVWLIKDMQQAADTTPVIADVLETTFFSGLPNWNNRKRFKILSKKSFYQDTSKAEVMTEFTQKLNFKVTFNGPLNTDIQKNGIYFIAVSNEAVNVPSLRITKRLVYTDV